MPATKPSRSNAFRDAIDQAEHLTLHEGLQAIAEGKGMIRAPKPVGSVNIDRDCKPHYPQTNRWDYAIGVVNAKSTKVHYVEVHPAETNEVKVVIRKLEWLREFLEREAQAALKKLPSECHWLASGRVRIPKTTPQYRRLQLSQIRFHSKALTLE